ncbi:MAG: tetratricopeptide repeat protein, partial [Planctomycetota bacterium]
SRRRALVYLAELRIDAARGASAEEFAQAQRESAELFDRARTLQRGSLPALHADLAWPDERQGVAFYGLGLYDEAKLLLERALACRASALRPEHPFTGRTLYNLACVARVQRDWVATRDYLERSLAIRSVSDRPNAIYCLRELGAVALEFGDPLGARQWFERGLALEDELNSSARKRGLLLTDLAGLYTPQDGPEALKEALARADAALSLLQDSWERSDAFLVRAELRRHVPDPAGMLADLRAAREVLGGGADAQRHATLLQSEATVRESSGELEEADGLLRQAIEVMTATFGADHGGLESPLYQLAALEFRRGRFEACARAALRAEAAFQHEWSRTTRGFEEERLLTLQERFSRSLDLALLAAVRGGRPELLTEAWEALVAARSQGFEELRARHEALRRTKDEHVRALERELAAARGRLARAYVASRLATRPSDELDSAREERNAAERRLALALRDRPEAPSVPKLAALRAALPKGAALIAFAPLAATAEVVSSGGEARQGRAERELAAFVLRHDRSEPTVALVLPQELLEARIEKLALLAELGLRVGLRQAGMELTSTLWEPLARALEGVTLAFVVPAGP